MGQPLQIHVGEDSPAAWDEREGWARINGTTGKRDRWGRKAPERPKLSTHDFPWEMLGVEPRFVGAESIDCVAALQPNIFHQHGDVELRRYLEGARSRDETAILLSMIGSDEVDPMRSVLSTHDSSVSLPGEYGNIAGRRLPGGARAELADGLEPTEKDLALRLRNRPADSLWWAIEPGESVLEAGDGSRRTTIYRPGGTFEPLLVNGIGETLAGLWIPDSEDWRWYVIPWGTDWPALVDWVVQRAVTTYVPGALRRARAVELIDDELLTRRELAARDALKRFDEEATLERTRLQVELADARNDADEIRFGLLYGSSRTLVLAVKSVLDRAFDHVEDLDATFGEGVSSDLLASIDRKHWLVEIKAASGNAGEDLVADLEKHLRTWPQLGRREELAGGVLIVNHQHNREPLDRQPEPYTRREFVASLPGPVIPTLALFRWWRDDDRAAIVDAVTGLVTQYRSTLARG